jgi:hypothetical protein
VGLSEAASRPRPNNDGVIRAVQAVYADLVTTFLQFCRAVAKRPFVRFDGYYVISGLAGVPDLFDRAWPIARSLITGSRKAASVRSIMRHRRKAAVVSADTAPAHAPRHAVVSSYVTEMLDENGPCWR